MRLDLRSLQVLRLVVAITLLLTATFVFAADHHQGKRLKLGQYNPDDKTVEMFTAIDSGAIGVKLIPKDSTVCRVMIENKTDRPLNVKLPEAFAGVPVLAQFGGGGGGGMGGGGSQGMGGGMEEKKGQNYFPIK